MRTHPSVSFRLAATALACAAALTAGVSHADTYFAVLPLLDSDASQAKRLVKMVLASATPVGFQKSWPSFARQDRAAELKIDC